MDKPILSILSVLIITVCLTCSLELAARGAERRIALPPEQMDLKPGKGLDKVQANCLICHSADYITMQPRFSRAQWTAAVAKMIRVMGARITDDDARIISDYLTENYGTVR